jgi:hypothetical protein
VKYFEKQTVVEIAADEDGNRVWYPWAVLGKGVLVGDEAALDQIRILKRRSRFGILFFVLALGFIPSFWNLIAIPVYVAWYLFELSKATKGLPVASEKGSYRKFARSLASTFSYGYLIAVNLLLAVSLAVMLFGPKEKLAGVELRPLIIIVMLFAAHISYVLFLKYKSRSGALGQ